MECPSCSAVIDEGDGFCAHCGADLRRRCPRCWHENPPEASFCVACGGSLTGPEDAASRPEGGEAVRSEAGRRQLTVMFCDLVDSTALSARLDPEDLRRVIQSYQACCAQVIERYDGRVAKYMGDGVLAYFGYPEAHEGNPERAVRAGIDLVDAVPALAPRSDLGLAVRIGIATGMVVVGELIGEGVAREWAVLGETPNLAARLQAMAEPGWVVIDARTRRLTGQLFEQVDLGEHEFKGFARPIRPARAVGPSGVERFEALRATALTPLIGRDQEIGLLLDRFAEAREGEGQLVVLSGEPGIGKSRIVQALRERLGEHRLVLHQCLPYYRHSGLQPVIEELERAAGIARADGAAARLDKLTAHLRELGLDQPATIALLAALLGIPLTDRALAEGPADARKRQTLEVLCRRFERLARRGPLLVVFEDAHWLDPTSRELLERLADQPERLPALVVVTTRPGARTLPTGRANLTALSLNRLSGRQARAMVERLTAPNHPLPEDVVARIVARTDGVPLFVEELTRAVVESRTSVDGAGRVPVPSVDELAVPATLQDSLTARLDRLGPVREVAAIAAVIGRDFSHELLGAVALLPEAELRAALARLRAAGLIFVRGQPPEATYTFKHALVQETAYRALLRERREELHERIARVLAAEFPEVIDGQPELIAHHLTAAGQDEEAVEFWREAGALALARSAVHEAVAHLETALQVLARFPDGRHRQRTELGLQTMLGGALIAARSFADPATGRAYARASELCRLLGDGAREFPNLFGRWIFHAARAERDEALAAAARMLQIAAQSEDPARLVVAHRALANTRFFTGELAVAEAHAEHGLAHHDPERHAGLARLYAADPAVLCRVFLAHAGLLRGHAEAATGQLDRALAAARDLDHVVTLAHGLHHGCMFWQLARRADLVAALAEELIALAAAHGLPFWRALGEVFHGWAWAESGDPAGTAELEKGVAHYRATSGKLYLPYALALQAQVCRVGGRLEDGRAALVEAKAVLEGTRMRGFAALVHLIEGRLALAGAAPDPAAAEACWRRAMAVAEGQGARLWQLRGAVDLARLWCDQGRRADARALLAPLLGAWCDDLPAADREEAAALLDQLGGAAVAG